MAFTYVAISHTFETAGDVAAAGSVEFIPVTPMHNGITVVQKTVTAALSGAGTISQSLAANTDPDTRPTGTTYKVTERITGQSPLVYYIQIPHDDGPALDLRDLAGWQGSTGSGSGTVNTINSEGPDGSGNVVVSASDVGAQPADADLTGLAALDDGVPVRAAGTWGLATGTRDGSRFLRDDGTWQPAPGGVSSVNTQTGAVVLDADDLADGSSKVQMTTAERTKLAGVATGATVYTTENAQDDAAALFSTGSHTGISFTYTDTANRIDAVVTGGSGIPPSTVDAKGDLIAGTAADIVGRLAAGTNGQFLKADSATTTGLIWQTLATIATSGSAADLVAGTAPTARLGTGTANSASFLRGDQTWVDPNTLPININVQTGTTYTFVLGDASALVRGTSASPQTYTLPPNSSVAFPTGTEISIMRYGAGTLTIAGGSGVTVRTTSTFTARAQYSIIGALKIAADEWVVTGDLT
jgi:hypothetical protein